ncbi:MAG TPA: hypothetical protein VF794_17880 [Archangium sp.]|jgi:hypothetical protein|uniref:hypothetical protein n=1 Tax=Archangium sp. TaxID=1872627 RepID=UPI002EDB07A5
MTSGRFWFHTCALPGVLALLSASTGCTGGGGSPCSNCPPIEGRYALQLEESAFPEDCGEVAVDLPEGPLEVSRQGSDVTATLNGMTLRGTLYTTYDFNLLGVGAETTDGGIGGLESASLSGRYIPAVGDGGVPRLRGDWQGTYSGTSGGGTRYCTVTRPFTAPRQ